MRTLPADRFLNSLAIFIMAARHVLFSKSCMFYKDSKNYSISTFPGGSLMAAYDHTFKNFTYCYQMERGWLSQCVSDSTQRNVFEGYIELVDSFNQENAGMTYSNINYTLCYMLQFSIIHIIFDRFTDAYYSSTEAERFAIKIPGMKQDSYPTRATAALGVLSDRVGISDAMLSLLSLKLCVPIIVLHPKTSLLCTKLTFTVFYE